MATEIPVRNWYYLFAYAWEQFQLAERLDTGEDFGPDAASFFAHVLIQGCEHLFRRGVDRSYQTYNEERTQLRGRIDVLKTARHDSLRRARIWCEFDELQHNALQNRLIKATLEHLAKHESVPKEPKKRLRAAIKSFDSLGVSSVKPRTQLFRRVQLHRSNAFYSFLLHLCELVHKMLFPEQEGRAGKFASLPSDEKGMHRIFERFVRNFYREKARTFRVRSEYIEWDRLPGEGESLELLPVMHTDISLRNSERTIIVDTKFYSETLSRPKHHSELSSGESRRKKLHSENLYQLFAYVKNLESRGGPDRFAEGILLYPTVDREIDHSSVIQGHRMSARTVDLTMLWKDINTRLLSLLDPI